MLLAILSKEGLFRTHALVIYRHLGDRILSKMQHPLALANHCIALFANDSELQIELLACLFVLVGKHGLEMERFYPKLEALARQRS